MLVTRKRKIKYWWAMVATRVHASERQCGKMTKVTDPEISQVA